MSLSPIKHEILETLLLNDKPMKTTDIARETGKEYQPVNMHLLGLIKMGYANVPEKGFFAITQKGKKAIGVPEVSKEKATTILMYSPHDKAFNFYITLGNPLNLHAHSLRDFANKLEKADVLSLEFHMQRGDFEAWFKGLGDEELSRKTVLLKQKNLSGEELRKKLREIVEQRYLDLAKISGQLLPKE